MKISITKPKEETLSGYLASMAQKSFSYAEIGGTQTPFPTAYDHDHNRVQIGEGQADFMLAKRLIMEWKMFALPWVRLYSGDQSIEEGKTVSVLFRLFGLWWFNSCRIVYTIDTPTRFGFAYGTLEGHVEKGEERFMVEIEEDGKVWYSITAFSRPNIWVTKIAYPIARMFQKRFVQDSFRAMQLGIHAKKKHEVV